MGSFPSTGFNGKSAPSDYVWALVSGFPSDQRGSRLAMILQAVIDDSKTRAGRTPSIFMLGGLIASVDQWAAFADEWRAELDGPPKADYFKLSQALSLTVEFSKDKGWTEPLRDERLISLASIARKHSLRGISCTLDSSIYDEFVRDFSPFKELRNPYFLCFFQLVDAITEARGAFPGATGLDYIFDDQGDVGARAVEWWKRLKSILPLRAPELMGSTPVHRDDRSFLPLQAADLYAGLKRHQIEHGRNLSAHIGAVLNAFDGLEAWQREYTRDDLLKLGAGLVIKRATRKP